MLTARVSQKDNITMDLDVGWTHLNQNKVQWRARANTAINLQVWEFFD
jgi:hypothetical protein